MKVSDERLAELRALAERALDDDAKATPGPWEARMSAGRWWVEVVDGETVFEGFTEQLDADTEFAAAARTREPDLARGTIDLLDALTAARDEVQALRRELGEARGLLEEARGAWVSAEWHETAKLAASIDALLARNAEKTQ